MTTATFIVWLTVTFSLGAIVGATALAIVAINRG
jgi:hypothetical protein